MRSLFVPAVWFVFVATPVAQVLRVPADHPTIGDALRNVSAGTTVLVAPGTYRERVEWPADHDDVRLIAEGGAAVTVLDAQQQGRTVTLDTGSWQTATIEGFTITGGVSTTNGGGVLIGHGNAVIRSCRITANSVLGSVIGGGGGGVHLNAGLSLGRTRIEFCEIDHNVVDGSGTTFGAIGAGINAGAAEVELVGNDVHHNVLRGSDRASGAGIFLSGGGRQIVASNIVRDNAATGRIRAEGGGIHAIFTDATIVNNTIVQNAIATTGTGDAMGGGLYFSFGQPTVRNNLVVGNTTGIFAGPLTVAVMDFNNVWGNPGGGYGGAALAGANSLSVDPQFDPSRFPFLVGGSPCIDVGDDAAVPLGVDMDPDGDPRILDGDLDGNARVDIGADEYSPASLTSTGVPTLGSTVNLTTAGRPGQGYGLLLGFGPEPSPQGNFGTLLLGAQRPILLASGTVPANDALAIPAWPELRGLKVYVQSLVYGPGSLWIGNLTNRWEGTIH